MINDTSLVIDGEWILQAKSNDQFDEEKASALYSVINDADEEATKLSESFVIFNNK